MSDNKEKNRQNEIQKKELDFVTCPLHNVTYPKGSSCPSCKAVRK